MGEFFKTRMGARFYEHTMPEIATQLQRIADALEKQAAVDQQRFDALHKSVEASCVKLTTPREPQLDHQANLISLNECISVEDAYDLLRGAERREAASIPKHYQTGADSCFCGNIWPCVDQNEAPTMKLRQEIPVVRGSK